jgi:hypothetical protein
MAYSETRNDVQCCPFVLAQVQDVSCPLDKGSEPRMGSRRAHLWSERVMRTPQQRFRQRCAFDDEDEMEDM